MPSFRLLVAVVLAGVLVFSSTQNVFAAPTELYYDDGSMDWGIMAYAPSSFAVEFSLPSGWSSAHLLTARYDIAVSNMSAPHSFTVRILGWDRATDLTPPFNATPSANGWFDVDLTAKNIIVPVEFYVVMTLLYDVNSVSMGGDASAPISYRSWYSPGGAPWEPKNDVNYMIRAVVGPYPVVADLAGFTESDTGGVLMVIGDLALNPHGSKPSGVGYQQGRDTTPLGYISGMLNNTQPSIFDTNAAINSTTGRPIGSWPMIFSIGGPGINAVTHYYEGTSTAFDQAPVKFGYNSTHFYWTFTSNGTIVPGSEVLQSSTNVPPGTSDVFVIQILRDADGRLVAIMYGTRYTGTWADAEYFKSVVYPTISSWMDSYYIVRWTDATSGTSANFMPDSGDTYTILAQGAP